MELAYVFMNDAVRVSVTPEQVTAENVEHMVYHVALEEKMPLLVGLLRREPNARVLVFVNMRRTAERIERTLQLNGVSAAAITGDVDQRRRLRLLEDFKSGALPVLVATDVASRGLHIEGVTHVINYDLPLDAEDYVHRIGRTARAGASGKAITLACEDYVQGLEPIEAYIGFKLPFTFPEDGELARDVRHAPRERRDRGRGPRGERRDHHQQHGLRPRHERPASPGSAPLATAPEQTGGPKRRRRRRRGGGNAPPAGTGT
jgi:ATP-dependent RNA helicase RhlB